MLNYKWYRWIRRFIFGDRSFKYISEDGSECYVVVHNDPNNFSSSILLLNDYEEEWPERNK